MDVCGFKKITKYEESCAEESNPRLGAGLWHGKAVVVYDKKEGWSVKNHCILEKIIYSVAEFFGKGCYADTKTALASNDDIAFIFKKIYAMNLDVDYKDTEVSSSAGMKEIKTVRKVMDYWKIRFTSVSYGYQVTPLDMLGKICVNKENIGNIINVLSYNINMLKEFTFLDENTKKIKSAIINGILGVYNNIHEYSKVMDIKELRDIYKEIAIIVINDNNNIQNSEKKILINIFNGEKNIALPKFMEIITKAKSGDEGNSRSYVYGDIIQRFRQPTI